MKRSGFGMTLPELLMPAGNFEKLMAAVIYGADAVYIGGPGYGLRAYAGNFTLDQMKEAAEYCRRRGVKLYVTLNIFPHNEDLEGLDEYIKAISSFGADGVIVSDPGVFAIAREISPELKIHISTQANTVNWRSAKFWQEQGASRIILARELNLGEIKRIRDEVSIELEAFVHGAMCISYSGRCLLSNYMNSLTDRDANRGRCAQPCRWSYALMEEKRPGEYFPIEEDERGTYIFNSKDLCMIEHIPELAALGLDSLKVEGRMKSLYYIATVTRAYRRALDALAAMGDDYSFKEEWIEELRKASHREFTTGFYYGKPGTESQRYHDSSYIREYDFVGKVERYDPHRGRAFVAVKNRLRRGDEVEFMNPDIPDFTQVIEEMIDPERGPLDEAHANYFVEIPVIGECMEFTLLRCKKTMQE